MASESLTGIHLFDVELANLEPLQPDSERYFHNKKKLIPYDIDGDGVPEVLIEKLNSTTHKTCPNVGNQLPTENDCSTTTYNESKYIVIKQQENSFPFSSNKISRSAAPIFANCNSPSALFCSAALILPDCFKAGISMTSSVQ